MRNKTLEMFLCASPLLYLLLSRIDLFAKLVSEVLLVFVFLVFLVHQYCCHFRWQLIPFCLAYSLAIFDIAVMPTGIGQTVVVISIVVFTALSLMLVLGLPTPTLPVPEGRYKVGTVDTLLVDKQRYKNLASKELGREIAIKIWYPAQLDQKDSGVKPESLWSNLIEDKITPKLMHFLLQYLKSSATHSYPSLAFNIVADKTPIIFYCPGMVSFVSENTMLMEHLASKGFVVVSVCHRDQFAEFKALSAEQPKEQKEVGDKLIQALKRCGDPIERAKLSRQLYAVSDVSNNVVAGRVEDLHYTAKKIGAVLSVIPDSGTSTFDQQKIALVGFSLGGAVVTEYSKQHCCEAVINLDGGLFGWCREDSLTCPYLMVYSEAGKGSNEELLAISRNVSTQVIDGSFHLNLHDAGYIFPIMRWLRMTGKQSKMDLIVERNRIVSEFLQSETST